MNQLGNRAFGDQYEAGGKLGLADVTTNFILNELLIILVVIEIKSSVGLVEIVKYLDEPLSSGFFISKLTFKYCPDLNLKFLGLIFKRLQKSNAAEISPY